ncbi:MAG: PepSY domain-containing protein [Chitinophagaceae bacterium]|nr:PepSY domain-containing protein [Oligoflexus sp.]
MKVMKLIVFTTLVFAGQLSFAAGAVKGKDITESDAKKIALKEVAGEVKEVERENEHGQDVYSVDVAKDGKIFEVSIDPKSGKVLRVEEEKPGQGKE